MPEQISDPLAIANVSLSTRDLLDVMRVDQQQHEAVFQQIPDGQPVGG
jgi:hypothetical protein